MFLFRRKVFVFFLYILYNILCFGFINRIVRNRKEFVLKDVLILLVNFFDKKNEIFILISGIM